MLIKSGTFFHVQMTPLILNLKLLLHFNCQKNTHLQSVYIYNSLFGSFTVCP